MATVSLPVTVDLGTSNIWMGLQAPDAVPESGGIGYLFSDKDAAVGWTHDFFFQVPGFNEWTDPNMVYGSFAYALSVSDQSCEGDANGDGAVDPLDAGYVLARFGCPVGTGDPDCDAADQNGDANVDPLDSGFVLARFGQCL